MKWLFRTLLVLASLATLVGCGGKGHSANPPSDLTATAGDGMVTLTWTQEPGVQYWVYFAPAASISVDNWTSLPLARALTNVSSPLVVPGLLNGATYSFTMDARVDGGPRGSATPSISSVPRPAGTTGSWHPGAAVNANDLRSIVFSGTGFVAVGLGGTIATAKESSFVTTAGTTFAAAGTISDSSTPDLYAVCYGGSSYVAAGAGGKILYTGDLATWTVETSPTTSALYGLATNNSNYYVGVGAGGAIVYSSGGTSWTAATSPVTTALRAVAYGGSRYVAVGVGGVILTSPDGVTWTSQSSPTTSDLLGVAYGYDSSLAAYRYVAVGTAGAVVTSSDGTTWTAETSLSGNLNAVRYGTQFVIAGDGGAVYTSTSGASDGWTAQATGSTANLYGLARGYFTYAAVGASGAILLAE